jgi:ElaB/YqjD/DUF883 family membrane-anchored ribosome-binding protein
MADTTRSETTAQRGSRASTSQSATATAEGTPHGGQQGRSGGGNESSSGGNESSFVGRVKDRAGERLSAQKDRATEGMQTMAQAVRDVTHKLRDDRHDTIAEYVDRAAEQLDRLSQQVRNKDVGELFGEAQNFARRRPGMFIGSAFAIGLLGARFLKSSSPDRPGQRPSWQRGSDDRSLQATASDRAAIAYSRNTTPSDQRIGTEPR